MVTYNQTMDFTGAIINYTNGSNRDPIMDTALQKLDGHPLLNTKSQNITIILFLGKVSMLRSAVNSPLHGLHKIPAQSVSWPPTSYLMS